MKTYTKPETDLTRMELTQLIAESPTVTVGGGEEGPGYGGGSSPEAGLAPRNPNLWSE